MAERKVTITTEHSTGIPKELLGTIKLVVPAFINFTKTLANAPPINESISEDQVLKDKVNFFKLFSEKIQQGYMFSTAAPHFDLIVKNVNEEVPEGDVLHIATGVELSALNKNAVIAAEIINKEAEGKRRMEVVDSQFASIGVALVALEADKLAGQGLDIDKIKEILTNDFIPRLHVFTYIDSAYYALVGGRVKDMVDKILEKPLFSIFRKNREKIIQSVQKFAFEHKGDLDNFRGMLKVEKGKIVTETLLPKIGPFAPVKNLMDKIENMDLEQVMIAHFNNIKGAELLAKRVEEKTGIKPIITELSPSIAAHHGPGGLGIAVVEKKKNIPNTTES